ncbi:MAG TPA: adenylate/guanylate cyclase domain-containing protein [Anaerolineales bacterium]
MVGERRIVTILFCDIKGSTRAARQLDPEEWAEIINGAFEHMIRPVYKYEGTVARLMGDAILAFFGAPIAHEDDPQRAVLAGLAINERIQPYRQQVLDRWGLEFNVRVGVNTGLVMVGQVGSDLQMEYTALGDAINLAARMEQTAQPGTVQVSDDTYKLIAPQFEFQDLGLVDVAGRDEPVHTYRPLAIKMNAGLSRTPDRTNAPMIGREKELERLSSLMDNLQQGIGGIVCILGEPGLGKSRLVQELYASVIERDGSPDSEKIHWWETASLSYEASQPYAIFQRLLRRLFALRSNDSRASIDEKIRSALLNGPLDQNIFLTLLTGSAGLEDGGRFSALSEEARQEHSGLEGEAFKRQLFNEVYELWKLESSQAPTAIVFDDLHWADPASTELLEHLFRLTDSSPLLLICALRPDREAPSWRLKQTAEFHYPHRYLEISLRSLSREDTNHLLDNLLDVTNLPEQLRRRVIEKTDGNPFFVEEVVRALVDSGALTHASGSGATSMKVNGDIHEIDIPENLQAILSARIDRLEEQARRTLQLASVIGRSFYFRILDAVNNTIAAAGSQLDRQLLTLQRVELIREAARIPELEYVFRHSLTQEAAYKTILLRQRREFHLRVGEAIEQLFPERVDEFAAVLAHHFHEARDRRAFDYALLAGDAAFRLFAIPEALAHYSHALSAADAKELEPGRLLHLYLRRGRCFELLSRHADAIQNYESMRETASQLGNPEMELEALLAQATVNAIPSTVQNTAAGKSLAQQALALSDKLGDERAQARILWVFMLLEIYAGGMRAGIPYGQRSVHLSRQYGLRDQLAYSLQDLALAYIGVGRLADADQALGEAGPIWEDLGNLPMRAENLANAALVLLMTGRFAEGIAASEEAFRIAQSIDNHWGQTNARVFVGLIHLARGEIDRALERAHGMIASAEKVGHPAREIGRFQLSWLYYLLGDYQESKKLAEKAVEEVEIFLPFRPINLAMLAKHRLREGKLAEAEALFDEIIQLDIRDTLLIIDVVVDLVSIELSIGRGDSAESLEKIQRLMTQLEDCGASYFMPDLCLLKAQVLLESDEQLTEAYEALQSGRRVAERIGSGTVLWRILGALAQLERQRGNQVEGAEFMERGREIAGFIAGNISDSQLRAAFHQCAEAQGVKIKLDS